MARKVNKIEEPKDDFFDLISASGIIFDRVEPIKEAKFKDVKKVLCKYRGFVKTLRTELEVDKYISQCVKNGIVSIDTETDNKLDPHKATLVGFCLYTPYNRPVYIPIRHRDKVSNELLKGQVSKDFMKSQVDKLSKLKCIFHNAKFDVNVIRNNYDIVLPIYWDTYIAAKVLDENRRENGLKSLYVEGIEPTQTSYHVTTFFEDNEHSDIDDFALYSAIDAYDTYRVYEWQNKELSAKSMAKLRSLLVDLEFKVTQVCADMEDKGVEFNQDYCQNFLKTESVKLKKMEEEIMTLLEPYKEEILGWKDVKGGRGLVPKLDPETGLHVKEKVQETKNIGRGKTHTKWVETDNDLMVPDPYAGVDLGWPVLLTSPQKVLCLLNCILGIEISSTEVSALKGTGNNIAILIGKYRHQNHNLTSFFVPYSELANEGRMYATFNQMGGTDKKSEETSRGKSSSPDKKDTVVTGRFSCKNPNLEQLPARQGEDGVRMLFSGSKDVDFELQLNSLEFSVFIKDKVETNKGFIPAEDLKGDEYIVTDEGLYAYKILGRTGENVDMLLLNKFN